jgi:anaerobic magnesium-protoporphyrin IX monomethyl ester cyclase
MPIQTTRVLLINASIRRGLAYGLDDGMPDGLMRYLGGYMPLGVCSLAAVLLENGFPECEIIDAEAEDLDIEAVAGRVRDARPDLIGLSCMSFSFLYALELARRLKGESRTPIVVGGAHVDLYPREVLGHDCFDAGILGEGERSFLEVVRLCAASRGDSRAFARGLPGVPGVACRVEGRVVVHPERPITLDLDALPHPARHLLKMSGYLQNYLPNPLVSVLTARGCAYKCSYCCRPEWTRRVRYRSPERVVGEIEHCMRQHGARSFQFFDDTFTLDKRRVLEICRLIEERRLGIRFLALTRVDRLDREIAEALRRAGCACLSFGVESGDAGILRAMNKRYGPEAIGPAFELCREQGIDIVAYYLLGSPEETHASVQSTLRSIHQTRPSWFKANLLVPYPGSSIYEELIEAGTVPDVWRRMTVEGRAFRAPHICRALSRRQLERYRLRINLMPYLRLRSNLLNVARLRNPRNVLWSLQWLVQCLLRLLRG